MTPPGNTLVGFDVGVDVPAGVAVGEPGVFVLVGVEVIVGVRVMVGVLVGPQPGSWEVVPLVTPQLPTLIGPTVTDCPSAPVTSK